MCTGILEEVQPLSGLSVQLFGKLCIRSGDQALAGLEAHRTRELLVYMLLFRDHPHPRERLADLLWGEGTSAQVRKGLRQTLWKLQSVLAAATGAAQPCLLRVDADYVQYNAEADVWVDAAVFESAYKGVQGTPGSVLDGATAATLRQAAALYRGDLLDGWYQDWLLFERERFQHMYLELLGKLVSYSEAHGEYEAGVTYGTQILRYDRARERTHRALMRLYYLHGDRVGALRQYDRCVAALAEEIGVRPARRTVELREQIRADKPLHSGENVDRQPDLGGPNGAGVAGVAGVTHFVGTATVHKADLRTALGNGQATDSHAADNHLANSHAADNHLANGHIADNHVATGHAEVDTVGQSANRTPSAALGDLLGLLQRLRNALGEIEWSVDQEIDAIERALRR